MKGDVKMKMLKLLAVAFPITLLLGWLVSMVGEVAAELALFIGFVMLVVSKAMANKRTRRLAATTAPVPPTAPFANGTKECYTNLHGTPTVLGGLILPALAFQRPSKANCDFRAAFSKSIDWGNPLQLNAPVMNLMRSNLPENCKLKVEDNKLILTVNEFGTQIIFK